MAEPPAAQPPSAAETRARLQDVARLLRQSGTIDPESQRALAELLDELSTALATVNVPAAEVTHLAQSAAHLVESLHHPHDRSLVGMARDRLERTMLSAEAHAPVAVGLARRVLDALANIGI
jgi:hypothetical protein